MSRALELDPTLAARDPPLIVNMMGEGRYNLMRAGYSEKENAKTRNTTESATLLTGRRADNGIDVFGCSQRS